MCFNHTNLIEKELIKLILTFGNSSFQLFYILETKENFVENNVTLDIPISLTEYINVCIYRICSNSASIFDPLVGCAY